MSTAIQVCTIYPLLPTTYPLLLTTYPLLLTALLPTAHCPTTYCSLPLTTAHYPTTYCSLPYYRLLTTTHYCTLPTHYCSLPCYLLFTTTLLTIPIPIPPQTPITSATLAAAPFKPHPVLPRFLNVTPPPPAARARSFSLASYTASPSTVSKHG